MWKKSKKNKDYYETDIYKIILSNYGGVVLVNKAAVNDNIFCDNIITLKKELKRILGLKKNKFAQEEIEMLDYIEKNFFIKEKE